MIYLSTRIDFDKNWKKVQNVYKQTKNYKKKGLHVRGTNFCLDISTHCYQMMRMEHNIHVGSICHEILRIRLLSEF